MNTEQETENVFDKFRKFSSNPFFREAVDELVVSTLPRLTREEIKELMMPFIRTVAVSHSAVGTMSPNVQMPRRPQYPEHY